MQTGLVKLEIKDIKNIPVVFGEQDVMLRVVVFVFARRFVIYMQHVVGGGFTRGAQVRMIQVNKMKVF